MSFDLLLENLSNPALLFFFLGLIAVRLKSDLEIPANSSRFISIYLLLSIGFKGGQELVHSEMDLSILWPILFGIVVAVLIPFYTFFILKKKLGVYNAGAIAAAYGSVSAVTFVTTVSFLELQGIYFGGYMVAVMAVMEAPAIMVGVLLVGIYGEKSKQAIPLGQTVKHSLTNGSVLLIVGSLIIGFLASESQAEGIKPFTTDIFKGFLAVFLLDMGITSGRQISGFLNKGYFPLLFAIAIPLINGTIAASIAHIVSPHEGDQLLLSLLTASASYIAVPAAMKMAVPEANPGLYLPMSLAVTFPFNITIGIPLFMYIIQAF
ncbi:MAG: sodium-dependent bicarbonate transport family permease [Bacteroidota bacterium]